MKSCKLCRFSTVCNDLPGVCILIQYVAVVGIVGFLAYLFITSELLS